MNITPITGSHAGHIITYNERCVYAREVIGLDDEGNVIARPEGEVEAIEETFLFCETCGHDVTGESLGAGEFWETYIDPIIESPSGWRYRAQQENGDNVDCYDCGHPLNDDHVIVNDDEGFAYHENCLAPSRRA